jgi:hypothetical protein
LGADVGQGGVGVGQLVEAGLPLGFQGAGYQAVFGLDGAEGPFGPVCLIASMFDDQPGGVQPALDAAGDLVSDGGGPGDLSRRQGGQEPVVQY